MHRHAPLLYVCGLPALASLLLASMQACGGRVDLLDSLGDVPEIDASTNLGQPETLDASLPPGTADAGLDADAGDRGEAGDAGDASLVDANDGGPSLPAGTKGVAVNKTSAALGVEGFVLATQASAPNPAGAFNGAGTGNKAFLGFEALDGMPVTQLGAVTLRARRDVGSSLFYLNLQVDCDGDGAWNPAVDGIVVVDAGAVPALAFGATFTDVTIQPTDAVFTVVGGGTFPGGPTKCGLYSHLGGTRLALSALPAGAKFFGGATGDGGMPKSQPMPAVLFVLGDSSNLAAQQVTIASAALGGATYAFAP